MKNRNILIMIKTKVTTIVIKLSLIWTYMSSLRHWAWDSQFFVSFLWDQQKSPKGIKKKEGWGNGNYKDGKVTHNGDGLDL